MRAKHIGPEVPRGRMQASCARGVPPYAEPTPTGDAENSSDLFRASAAGSTVCHVPGSYLQNSPMVATRARMHACCILHRYACRPYTQYHAAGPAGLWDAAAAAAAGGGVGECPSGACTATTDEHPPTRPSIAASLCSRLPERQPQRGAVQHEHLELLRAARRE
eukprot:353005-Chlamydomonas_euryale.AAC.3